ncbi:MAG: hypothetical protein C0631_02975 [Sedimenticola sp.]|nr:MAG: hypothetical protein C0631_02975 [Sedimenticola sp.]
MISEISQKMTGVTSPQSRGDSGNASRVEEARETQFVKGAASGLAASHTKETAGAEKPVMTGEQLGGIVDDLNQFAQAVKRQLQFTVDDESGKTRIKVVDAESGDIIREIPSEEVANMQKRLKEVSDMIFGTEDAGVSLLFSDKA